MQKFFKALLFLGPFQLFLSVNAQDRTDYIITLKRDTLWGIVNNEHSTHIKFLGDTAYDYVKIKSTEIKGYKRKKSIYSSEILPDEFTPVFLQVLRDGKIKLYEYYKSTGSGVNYSGSYIRRWYVKKDDDPLFEVKSNWGGASTRKERKEAFKALIADYKELGEKWERTEAFDFDTVSAIIEEYNNWYRNLNR